MTTAITQIDELPIPMPSTTPVTGFAELYERHYEAVFRAALRVTCRRATAPGDVPPAASPGVTCRPCQVTVTRSRSARAARGAGVSLTWLGRAEAGAGVVLRSPGGAPLALRGYEHE